MDNRINNLALQLGSLNDEIKDTIGQINHFHQERENLLSGIEQLELRKGVLRDEVLKKKNELELLTTTIRETIVKEKKDSAQRREQIDKEVYEYELKRDTAKKEKDDALSKIKSVLSEKAFAKQAAEQAIASYEQAKIRESKQTAQLRLAETQMRDSAKEIERAEKHYEILSFSQTKLFEQIGTHGRTLKQLIVKAEAKRLIVSRLEELTFSLREALQTKSKQLKVLNAEYLSVSKALDQSHTDFARQAEDLKRAKSEFVNYRERELERIRKGDENVLALKKDYEKKQKDIRIVAARLKKLWAANNPKVSFPNIYES